MERGDWDREKTIFDRQSNPDLSSSRAENQGRRTQSKVNRIPLSLTDLGHTEEVKLPMPVEAIVDPEQDWIARPSVI